MVLVLGSFLPKDSAPDRLSTVCLCLGEGGYARRSGGDKGYSSLKDGTLQFISDTSSHSGDSLGEQEDRDYLNCEETEAQSVEGKDSFMVSVAVGLPYGILVLCLLEEQ